MSQGAQQPAPEPPVIFLHLPKNAGSTLHQIIRTAYVGRTIRQINGHPREEAEFRALPQAERFAVDVLMGHQHYGMHEYLRPGARYFAVLRHPVERAISHYHYVLRTPEHYLYEKVVGDKYSLRDYIERQTTLELDNDQVRWLNEPVHLEVPWGRVNRRMLESAKHRIASVFAAFGLAERFEESLALFRRVFGWPPIRYAKENVTPHRPRTDEIDGETIRLIESANELDLELFEFAQNLFAQRVRAARESDPALV